MKILTNLRNLNNIFKLIVAIILVGLIGLCDYITGYEISFSIFYVIPIGFIAWESTFGLGLVIAIISGFTWLCIDIGNDSYSNPFIPFWNGLVRLAFFLIVSVLTSKLKQSLDYEKQLARQDNLTGAANLRWFYELLQLEIERGQRYQSPLTIVYIDLDNFKMVNDQWGHSAGDQALQIVVNYLHQHLRKIDLVARLGGDEFALLMPDTDQNSAQKTLQRIQSGLLAEMALHQWPISFSMGVITANNYSLVAMDELIKRADDLMYQVKRHGKNSIQYGVYSAEENML